MLVPGDLVKIKLGDMIPGDCILQKGRDLEIDQSVITGESLSVTRGSGCLVYSGSLIVSGNMTAVIFFFFFFFFSFFFFFFNCFLS
jgi:H+-transporting ATPase